MLSDILDKVDNDSVKSILDVGCGDGVKTNYLCNHFSTNTIGIDFTQSGIDVAQQKFDETPNLNFICVDASEPHIYNEKFDMISCFEVLEHVDDWQTLVDQFANTSNRWILLSFPAGRMRKYEHQIGHVRNFRKGEIERYLMKHGFSPVEVFYAGFPFLNPITKGLLEIFYGIKAIISKNSDNAQEKIDASKESHDETNGGSIVSTLSKMYAKPTFFVRMYSNVFYFLYRHCSSKYHFGGQFLGLFEKP